MTALLAAVVLHAATPYVAHEWGTFTAVVDEGGHPLTWSPFDYRSDLPSFVEVFQGHGKQKQPPTTIRMETPVIYFYPREAMTLKARVGFPSGTITEVYPPAKTFGHQGVDWGDIELDPKDIRPLKREDAPSHYYPAREVDAAQVEANGGWDRFLFYRGVGDFPLPMAVKLDGPTLSITGRHGATIIFERRGDALGLVVLPKGATVAPRPALNASIDDARWALLAALLGAGLYEKEARAMLATWNDAWFEPGLRVFSVLDTADTDAVLPLTLDPKPTELKRVLIGRIEVLSPERQAAAAREPEKTDEREGRFARTLLALVASKTQGPDRERIERAMYRR
jgi:hypothetical protein